MNDLKKTIGLCHGGGEAVPEREMRRYINLKLAFLGLPTFGGADDSDNGMIATLLSHHFETARLLGGYLAPPDQRIQNFLSKYLQGVSNLDEVPRLPAHTFVLDHYGLARALSLPPDRNEFSSDILSSYRARQGVLHNPRSDRRTTQGIFHVAEGGLPIPDDKRAVPRRVFAQVLARALQPPKELLQLPFTSSQEEKAECWVSLLLRPLVCPAVAGYTREKTMEIRFFAPGSMVSNLDFVESIFGNAGDPFLPENDAGLDVEHWTGHSGCVILAPHLVRVTKKEVGLPHFDEATERQRLDGMCWKDEGEKYNNGGAFKLTCRDESGVMVTIIADNYFGYCKKEVKTQISFAANLFAISEEEHAGGALVFPSFDLGEEFSSMAHAPKLGHSFEEVLVRYGERMEVQPEGHAIDKKFPEIVYVPENVCFDLQAQTVSWPGENAVDADGCGADSQSCGEVRIKLLPNKIYVRPSGYKIRMAKPSPERAWRLVGTLAEGNTVPQALHGFRRRQIRDFKADLGRHHPRPCLCG
jgi:hypothetical protein